MVPGLDLASMLFSGVIYLVFRADSPAIAFEKFTQFQSAYWIEKALSVDNLFVFILVFGFFNVPKEVHHKVLFWGSSAPWSCGRYSFLPVWA